MDISLMSLKSKVEFTNEGQRFIIFQDKDDLYMLGCDIGDDKIMAYSYRAIDIHDLILQYPFIKQAAKQYLYNEQLNDILDKGEA